MSADAPRDLQGPLRMREHLILTRQLFSTQHHAKLTCPSCLFHLQLMRDEIIMMFRLCYHPSTNFFLPNSYQRLSAVQTIHHTGCKSANEIPCDK